MDERDRFTASFRAETSDRLRRLEQGLLALESDPRDAPLLDQMFRDAHNLKGGARMLGYRDVQEAAHRFEDELGAARSGEKVLDRDDLQRLFEQLDALRRLVDQAAGATAEGDGGAAPATPAKTPSPAAPEAAEARPERPGEPAAAAAADAPAQPPGRQWAALPPALPLDAHRLETIRIAPDRLDALMRRAVELNTARLRVGRRPQDIEASEGRAAQLVREALRLDVPESARRQLEALADELGRLRRNVHEDAARLESASRALEEGIRDARLVQVAALFDLLPRLVRDAAREQGKAVRLETQGGDARADKAILDQLRDPLMHLVRNAIDHGIESPGDRARAGKPAVGRLSIRARQTAGGVHLEVEDDGRGFDDEKLRAAAVRAGLHDAEQAARLSAHELHQLVFVPGFTTRTAATDLSGRGVGLDVVREKVERLKGRVELESTPGHGTLFRLRIPVTLLTAHVLVVTVDGRAYGVPLESVETTRRVLPHELDALGGTPVVETPRGAVPVVDLEDLLEMPPSPERAATAIARERAPRPCVVLLVGGDRLGILVDALRGEEEALVRPLGPPLERVRHVAGTTLLGTGEICTVLEPSDLMRSVQEGRHLRPSPAPGAASRRVLLVEDSIMTRTYERRILEEAGYAVVTAIDGVDAWEKLRADRFDAVVTDIEMPRMDGYALTERIRADAATRDLPVVMVTAHESEEHRRRGMRAGARAYVEKPSFNQTRLLDTLRELIG